MKFTPEELEAARHLLAHYDYPYPRACSFTTKLMECMQLADPSNRSRLLMAFPQFRVPLSIASTIGADELDKLVRKQESR